MGDGVKIAQKGYADTMPRGGDFPPMKELLASFIEQGGKMWVCGPCIKTRDIPESDLIEASSVKAAGSVNLEAIGCGFRFLTQGPCFCRPFRCAAVLYCLKTSGYSFHLRPETDALWPLAVSMRP
jgi:intracellular sulfur oxidation DsrE/DsrF family protein